MVILIILYCIIHCFTGVELRIRREVTDITEDSDGGFTITVNHWEPSAYLNAVYGSPKYMWFIALLAVVCGGVYYTTEIESSILVQHVIPLVNLPINQIKMGLYGISTLIIAVALQVFILGKYNYYCYYYYYYYCCCCYYYYY